MYELLNSHPHTDPFLQVTDEDGNDTRCLLDLHPLVVSEGPTVCLTFTQLVTSTKSQIYDTAIQRQPVVPVTPGPNVINSHQYYTHPIPTSSLSVPSLPPSGNICMLEPVPFRMYDVTTIYRPPYMNKPSTMELECDDDAELRQVLDFLRTADFVEV